jgi:ribosomal protein S18 acetylase RimI-like enzyme
VRYDGTKGTDPAEEVVMIRPATPADTPTLVEIARGTGVFKPLEIDALKEVLADYYASNHAHGHRAMCLEQDGGVTAFAYFAPAAMTDRTWYLYWIAVNKGAQASGLGGALLRHVEGEARAAGARLLIIETSSLPHYDLTRRFYRKQGYDQEAVLRDYYADGDNMVIFRKRLAP